MGEKMNKYLKIIVFGFFVWLIPFLVSFVIFPLKASMRPLFESIMPLVLTITVIILAYYYLENINADYLKEGLILGVIWFIINIAIDLAMFMLASPMHMNFIDYMMDIGLTYVMIPVITIGMGVLLNSKLEKH